MIKSRYFRPTESRSYGRGANYDPIFNSNALGECVGNIDNVVAARTWRTVVSIQLRSFLDGNQGEELVGTRIAQLVSWRNAMQRMVP